MKKITTFAKFLRIYMPTWLVRLLSSNRDTYRGAQIDAKAYAVGQLANAIRGDGPMPTITQSRIQMAKTAKIIDHDGPKLARVENINIAGADGPILARLYSDQPKGKPLPAMLYYHGGGFVQGDLETHDAVCAKLAKYWGGVVIAVEYRLAPEHPYPAGVDDAISAYLDVVARAGDLGIDPANIGVGGDSAGGCFAAVTAQQVLATNGPVPAFQVLIYPVTDGHVNSTSINELPDAYILPKARLLWYRDMYAGDFRDFDAPKFSPLFADDFAGLPDSYVVTGGFDPLMDDGAAYVQKLQDAGVNAKLRHFEGQVHAFINLTKVVPDGTVALKEIAAWLPKVN